MAASRACSWATWLWDMPLSDTMFVVAHFHMVYGDRAGAGGVRGHLPLVPEDHRAACWTTRWASPLLDQLLSETYAIFYPDALPGVHGHPAPLLRDSAARASFPDSAHLLNAWISIAAFVVGAAQIVFLYNLADQLLQGQAGGANP